MNIINRVVGSAVWPSHFTSNLWSKLSPKQQTIAVITCLAMSIFTILAFLYYRCGRPHRSLVPPSLPPNGNVVPLSSPPAQDNSIDSPPPGDTKKIILRRDPEPTESPLTKNIDDSSGSKNSFTTSQTHSKKVDFDPNEYIIDDDENVILNAVLNSEKGGSTKDLYADPYSTAFPYTPQSTWNIPQSSPQPHSTWNIPQSPKTSKVDYDSSPDNSPVSSPKMSHRTMPGENKEGFGQPQVQQVPHDPILSPLFTIEKEIQRLKADLQAEEDILKVLTSDAVQTDVVGMFADQEDKIAQVKDQLKKLLMNYPRTLGEYLVNRFNHNLNGSKQDHQEIFEHVVILKGLMETNSDNHDFIREGLNQIDLFLSKTFFTDPTESCLQEEKKVDLIVFHEFFTIVNEHYQYIVKADPKLAHRLRIKLANLPLVDGNLDRKQFKNIYLSESDQRAILKDHFQQKEDESVDAAIAYLKRGDVSKEEMKQLAKLVFPENKRLSPVNIQKLQHALHVQMGALEPTDWKDQDEVYKSLESYGKNFYAYQRSNYFDPFSPAVNGIKALCMASKAKRFFEQQPLVPRWYHSTTLDSVEKIIDSGEVRVAKRQAYNGAWVSTQREPGINIEQGDAVLIFSHDIADVDPNVFIGFEKGLEKRRWRGSQKPIPICKPKAPGASFSVPYLVIVGLGSKGTKTDKTRVKKLMRDKGINDPYILSMELIDYIQKHIVLVLGNPNLTEKWWGKAEVQDLDKPLKG